MRIIEIKAYKFNELSKEAQDNALEEYRGSDVEYYWEDEGNKTAEAFKDKFGWMRTADYAEFNESIEQYEKYIDNPTELTGYCMDYDIMRPIIAAYNGNNPTNVPIEIYNACLDNLERAMQKDYKYQFSYDAFSDHAIANGYEFTENGNRI